MSAGAAWTPSGPQGTAGAFRVEDSAHDLAERLGLHVGEAAPDR